MVKKERRLCQLKSLGEVEIRGRDEVGFKNWKDPVHFEMRAKRRAYTAPRTNVISGSSLPAKVTSAVPSEKKK